MPRNYVPVHGPTRRRTSYSAADLQSAVEAVKDGMSIRIAAKTYTIPRNTLHHNVMHNSATTPERPAFMAMGGQTVLLNHEERIVAQNLAVLSDWGCPLTKLDIKMMLQMYLSKCGREVRIFKDNLPGDDWVNGFINRHSHILSARLCQNINKKRAEISTESINTFFVHVTQLLKDVPADNIINYDETNFTNDPGRKQMVFRRGVKYPERIMNATKTSYSVMFAGTAAGNVLPPYVVYKAQRLQAAWTEGGPHGCRYNVSKSGWFDADIFLDWFKSLLLPFCRFLQGRKIVFGDNLSSHLHPEVFELCNENDIHFVFFPPNTTHLMQPLDVVFYAPLKRQWRETLTEWKKTLGKNQATLPKHVFPSLLANLLESMDPRLKPNMISGFSATGIYPIDRQRVLKRLRRETTEEDMQATKDLVSDTLLEKLKEIRAPPPQAENAPVRRKRVHLTPGKSHTQAVYRDQEAGPSKVAKSKAKRMLSYHDESSDEDVPAEEAIPDSELEEDEEREPIDIVVEGQYVLVQLKVDKHPGKTTVYVARVMEDTAKTDEVQVQFLRKSPDSKVLSFVYPTQNDIALVAWEDMQAKLQCKSERRGKYIFADKLLEKVTNFG